MSPFVKMNQEETFVCATIGKIEHPDHFLEGDATCSTCRASWVATDKEEKVDLSDVVLMRHQNHQDTGHV